MLGCYDFCGHYEWTFAWLDERGGHELVREYWDQAINHDSQSHARDLILSEGFEGMAKYWGHTLDHESAVFTITQKDDIFRTDMKACPSKGFLLDNELEQYPDYCDHCMGWIGPMVKEGGFVIDHEHNHRGMCWWEIRRKDDQRPRSKVTEIAGENDVRLQPDWKKAEKFDVFSRATDPDDKTSSGESES